MLTALGEARCIWEEWSEGLQAQGLLVRDVVGVCAFSVSGLVGEGFIPESFWDCFEVLGPLGGRLDERTAEVEAFRVYEAC